MNLEKTTFDQVANHLRAALRQLLSEPKLFEFKVNERTLTQRLSVHLQPLFQGLSVDCEYNRQWTDNRDLPKKLQWRVEDTKTDDVDGATVYPDIIVHLLQLRERILGRRHSIQSLLQSFGLLRGETYSRVCLPHLIWLVLLPSEDTPQFGSSSGQLCFSRRNSEQPIGVNSQDRGQSSHFIIKSTPQAEWARRVREPSNLRAVCTNCNEGLQNTALPKPDQVWLVSQVRRATIDDQKVVLDWLQKKFSSSK